MSRTSSVLLIVYGLAFVQLVSMGGAEVNVYNWSGAAVIYGLALVPVAAAVREAKTTTEPADHKPSRSGRCSWLRRLLVARRVRRARRTSCTCDRWYESLGREHDDWCPKNETFWRSF